LGTSDMIFMILLINREKMKRLYLLLGVSILLAVFYSCKKDDDGTYDVRPEDIVDENHVKVNDVYGITVVCPKGEWTNNYQDTLKTAARYAEFIHSNIALSLIEDTARINQEIAYPTFVNLMRFYYRPISNDDAVDFMIRYRTTAYEDLLTADFSDVTEMRDTTINGYAGKYFKATIGGSRSSYTGNRDVYLFYYNGTAYGVVVNVLDEFASEQSYAKCNEIVSTLSLK